MFSSLKLLSFIAWTKSRTFVECPLVRNTYKIIFQIFDVYTWYFYIGTHVFSFLTKFFILEKANIFLNLYVGRDANSYKIIFQIFDVHVILIALCLKDEVLPESLTSLKIVLPEKKSSLTLDPVKQMVIISP